VSDQLLPDRKNPSRKKRSGILNATSAFTYKQGDQIGRNRPWAFVFFWIAFKKLQEQPNFVRLLYSKGKLCINFDKNGVATFWASFSQTHLVALFARRFVIHCRP
jgi:hypothetical protein